MSAIPLSHTRIDGRWIFTAGQIGREPNGDIPADFGAQVRVSIENLQGYLEAAGGSLSSVVKTTVFLTRQSDFAAMNEIYATYFAQPWPARSTIVAEMVRPELLFEIEAIAVLEQN